MFRQQNFFSVSYVRFYFTLLKRKFVKDQEIRNEKFMETILGKPTPFLYFRGLSFCFIVGAQAVKDDNGNFGLVLCSYCSVLGGDDYRCFQLGWLVCLSRTL